MAKTSKNNIYYNDDENSMADVLSDMKELAKSTDEAIENAKYDDKKIEQEILTLKQDNASNKESISNIEEKNTEQDKSIANNTKSIEELQAENETLKSENKLIKEQIPSASVSGDSLHIEDSGSLDFDWKIRGGHAQAITTQPENYIDDREARGKTILEATSLYLPIVNLKAGSGYYFKIFDSNDKIKNDSRYLAVDFYDISKTKIQSDSLGYPNTFTEENANKIKFAKIYYNKNDTDKAIGSIVIKKIGLKITSSASADDIDMFVPDSPSLDYPSKIETVGSNINKFDINTVSYGDLDTATGQKINDATNIQHSDYIEVVSNENYIINFNNTLTKRVFYLDKDKNVISTSIVSTEISKFTTSENIKYLRVKIVGAFDKKTKLEKVSIATPYSPYEMGSVEIDVVNSNLVNFANAVQSPLVTVNTDGTITINGKGGFSLKFESFLVKANTKYYMKWELVSGSIEGIGMNNIFTNPLTSKWLEKDTFIESSVSEDKQISSSWVHANAVFTNAKIKMWISKSQSDFAPHQSQTAIMPIQQEMLEGDYIADVEHHDWEKIELTGDEAWNLDDTVGNIRQYTITLSVLPRYSENNISVISNYFKGVAFELSWLQDNSITILSNSVSLRIMTSNYTTVENFKAYLKQQYEAGTPVTAYYKLATPINLELTEEQKAVREQKLYTYKNITNIAVSDELASIDVEYKRDQDTINKNYENRLAALETASASEEA